MSPTGSRKNSSSAGFTLLELLVASVIVALLSALVFIRLEGPLTGGDLRSASRMVINEINGARGKAALNHRDQLLVLNIDREAFYSAEWSVGAVSPSTWEREEREGGVKIRRLPAGVDLEDVVVIGRGKTQSGEAAIRFYANGYVERSLIHLKNEADQVYTLSVSPLTGRVEVHEGYLEERIIQ